MKKLIMFCMVLMLCLGFAGEAKADPVCLVVCPTDAGDGDEVTVTAYDENDEWYDFRTQDGVELCFGDAGCVWSGGEGDEALDVSSGDGVFTITQDMLDSNIFDFWCWPDEVWFTLANPEVPDSFDTAGEAVAAGGNCGEEIPGCGPPIPIVIDPNVMLVYETGATRGDFGVSLLNEPPAGATITVTVDPNGNGNGWNEDIRLLGVTNPDDPNNNLTFQFTDSNWDVPQPVVFKAIDDDIAEPPELEEPQTILVSSSWPGHETDANFVGEIEVTAYVMDNDQADILFELVGTGPIRETPVSLVEYRDCVTLFQGICYSGWITFPQTIGVTLQVEPKNDESPGSQGYVRVIVSEEDESGNPPIMDPTLLPDGEPNAIVFTSDGNPVPGVIGAVRKWDVPFDIVVVGNDDDQLQAEGAEAEGGQYYYAYLVFYVDDTTDARYTVWDEGDQQYYGLDRGVDISIEDNECGAFGISYLDIGNPYAATDPNYQDEDGNPLPDCYVDIFDVIEFATKWLDCSDPQDPACESYL